MNGIAFFRIHVELCDFLPCPSGHWHRFAQLTTLVYYRLGKHKHVCETTEPWTPSKGRLEAFVFRSIMDSTKEAEREIARLQKLIQ